MLLGGRFSRFSSKSALLAALTLAVAGLFKVTALAREAFVASRFGLSSSTDAYFAFQQFPLTLAAFMFGAFALAFTPAYATEKRTAGSVPWLPGFVAFCTVVGAFMTLVMAALTPWLLRAFNMASGGQAWSTLIILSCSFAPVIWLGIWSGITTAQGRNLRAMIMSGLPYPAMTALLIALYSLGKLDALTLPISFLAGFAILGACTLPRLVTGVSREKRLRAIVETWNAPGFRRFLRQLRASSIENVGYAANQLLLVYFVAHTGTGAVSANTYAMRVGMVGLSLLSLPLAQLLQAKLCAARTGEERTVLKGWLPTIAAMVGTFAALIYFLRVPLTAAIYVHGKFSSLELSRVTEIIPCWIVYFVVMSLNVVAARYLFAVGRGSTYARRQICAYVAANLMRVALWRNLDAPLVVWCSVLAESCALVLNMQAVFAVPGERRRRTASFRRIIVHTPELGGGAGQYVAEFVKALASAGAPVTLFCPSNFVYEEDVAASGAMVVHAAGRDVVHATFRRRIARNLLFIARAMPQFWTTVRHGAIVHFQFKLHAGLSLLYLTLARMKRAFVVLTVHDPLPHRSILPKPLRWLEMGLLRLEYSLCDRLIVHNRTGKDILARWLCSSRKVVVIPHGLLFPMPPESMDEPVRAWSEPLRLLAFGSIRENKGLHLAIAAVQHLRGHSSNRGVELTIAGPVANSRESAYWKECLRLIEEQPAGIDVVERRISDSEIGPLFAAHDAVLLPYSRFQSESGVAILALCRRRPIIATAAGGLAELLSETDCGILIQTPTIGSVIAAIEQAASASPELLRRKGLNGYSHVLTNRSWDAIAERTLDAYQHRIRPTVVLHTPEPGSSAALYVEELSAALTREQVPLRVVCPANHDRRAVMEANPGIDVRACCERATRINDGLLAKLRDNLQFLLSSCKTLLDAAHPGDIVHLQYLMHLPFGLIFLACAWAKRANIVLTVHDPVPHKFLFPRVLRVLETGALWLAYRWSDVLIVHSEAGKRKLVEALGVSPEKIRVIVHGPYDLKKQIPACADTGRLEVLFFGSLRENKGVHLAIEATQKLAREGVPIRLTISGEVVNRKEQAYWQRCRTLIDPGSAAVCLRKGFVPHDGLADLISRCHCLVLPYTTFSSDSGVACMALANGRPIVATAAGGLGGLLESSGAGIRILGPSVDQVADALRHAVELGPDILARMGRTGAQWISAECGWPGVARNTCEVYQAFFGQRVIGDAPSDAAEESAELVGSLP